MPIYQKGLSIHVFMCHFQIELPDFAKMRKEQSLTVEEMRAKMKKEGICPPTPYQERPILISCTGM